MQDATLCDISTAALEAEIDRRRAEQGDMTDRERFSALREHAEQRLLVYAAGVPLVITEVSAEHDPPRIRVNVEPVRLMIQALITPDRS